MKRVHPNNPDGCTGTIVSASYRQRVSAEDIDRAKVWRRFNEGMTPAKLQQKAWRKSAEMRRKKAPVTLATKPFDHRGNS